MKKLLLLGGSRYLLPAIQAAHELGAYVITCDYLPDNYAHKFSDEYHDVSIIDKSAVLQLATELRIDGILSYATDPGVTTAAYVAERLGLPTSPYRSVEILQDKGKFRYFLQENGFNVPKARAYNDYLELKKELDTWVFPVIVKPTDSAGSKGVTRVDAASDMEAAVRVALGHSISSRFIVEDFIAPDGLAMCGDSFSLDGELVYFCLDDQWFDLSAPNPYTPTAHNWPSTAEICVQKEVRRELQRLIRLLDMGTTLYNVEARRGKDGKVYLMEVSPRAGGNRLAEVQRYATGQDVISASVKAALGLPVESLYEPSYEGVWGLTVIHSENAGVFRRLEIDSSIRSYLYEEDLWAHPGDAVNGFNGANESLGTLIWHTATQKDMASIFRSMETLIRVVVT